MTAAETTPDGGGPGRTTIAPRVVERLAVAAARESGALSPTREGLAALVRGRLPRASAVLAGQTARIQVQVAATWPEPAAAAAARVRDHVRQRVGELAGIDVSAVDVTIAEIVQQRGLSPRVQ